MLSVLVALAGSVVWGSADFAGGQVSRRLPPAAVVAWGQSAGLIAVGTFVLVTGRTAPLGAWLGWGALAGLCGAAMLVLFYRAMTVGVVGVVAPLVALGVLVPVVAGTLTSSPPSPVQWAGVVLGVSAAVAAGGLQIRSGGDRRSAGVYLALLAVPALGVSFLAYQRGAATDAVLTLLSMRVTTVTLFIAFALVRRTVGGVRPADLLVIAPVGLADATGNVLFGVATRLGNDAVAAVAVGLYPIPTVLLGALVLRERLRPVQWASSVLALVAVVLLAGG